MNAQAEQNKKAKKQPEESENKSEETPKEPQDPLKKLQGEFDELQDKYLRLGAEFENFKKRAERDRISAIRFANESLLLNFLPVLDHLEQAIHAGNASAETDPIVAGVEMVLKQFEDTLGKYGIKRFSAVGEKFDHSKHEAMAEKEAPEGVEPGHVIEEYQKGYFLHERLVRPARVVVAK